jgi:TonB family protein
MKLELKMVQVGQANLACVSAALQWEVDGKLQAPASAVPQNYCFDPSTLALRIAYSQSITSEFSQIVKTQGHYLAKQVAVLVGKQKVFSISVETIDGLNSSDIALSPPADAALSRSAAGQPIPGESADGVAIGSLVKKTQPVYPMVAKMAREQGVVVIGAVIGTDGRVRDLEVLAAPSKLLADSAVNAVKQWQYRPYLLNGVAVEVETVVDVTYSLGG